MNEETLFELALNTPTEERAALLDRECAGNPELLRRIEALLGADAAPKLLAEPPVDIALTRTIGSDSSFRDGNELAGTILAGKYRLSECIGQGGMGSVWLAHQTEPVKRKVAVKLIKVGMDSKSVLARFEAERQALAVMDHPNIAKVLDGGLHDGRPFFVMELVKGVPITEYCDARKLTPKERLELFVPVCNSIQHAHQKGIIHRDIKPSNVLIALYDDKPVPKVIDFGIAKATGGTLTEHTIETAFGGVVGTPQYMSPEQASLNNLDIDTRSDVYSLGVLLYELLTGSPPFARKELQKAGLLEILRVVREEEAPRPSVKLSTADALPSLSASRGTEPKKLAGLLRNELDWIVMKALEKDRGRRYETANGFAADVQRYLAGEQVQAVPPSLGYRVKKFVRRNKGQVVAASLIVLALLAGIAGTTVGLARAEQARQRESERADGERAERERAEAAQRHADEALAAVRRQNEANLRAVARLRDLFVSESVLKAKPELQGAALAQFREVLAVFEQLTDDLPEPETHRVELAKAYRFMGNMLFTARPDEACDAYRKGIAYYERLSAANPEQSDYAQKGAALHIDLSLVLERLKKGSEAEHHARLAIALLDGELRTQPDATRIQEQLARNYSRLGSLLSKRGEFGEANDAYTRSVALYQPVMRAEPRGLWNQVMLCLAHMERGRCLDGLGEPETARASWEEGIALASQLGGQTTDLGKLSLLAQVPAYASARFPDRRYQLLSAAVALLRRAASDPAKLYDRILTDADLDPLREHEDFKKLLADLEKKLPPPKELAPTPREKK